MYQHKKLEIPKIRPAKKNGFIIACNKWLTMCFLMGLLTAFLKQISVKVLSKMVIIKMLYIGGLVLPYSCFFVDGRV